VKAKPARTPSRAPGDAFTLADGRILFMRAIRPDDVDALRRGFARLTSDQVRLRVFHRMNDLSTEMAERLCKVRPDQGAAFVATDAEGEIRGEARIYIGPTPDRAEFALIVDPALVGLGVGRALMQRLLDESRHRGLREVWGSVLAENALMLDFASRFGAARESVPREPDLVNVRFDLADPQVGSHH
jgi:GNAT superfamily N-acetyltransferase